jgi:hypothetical protein
MSHETPLRCAANEASLASPVATDVTACISSAGNHRRTRPQSWFKSRVASHAGVTRAQHFRQDWRFRFLAVKIFLVCQQTQHHKELLLSNHREDQAFEHFRTPHWMGSYPSPRISTLRIIAVLFAYLPLGDTHVGVRAALAVRTVTSRSAILAVTKWLKT